MDGPIFVGGASTTATSTFMGNVHVIGGLKIGTNSIYLNDIGTSTFSGGIQTSAINITNTTLVSNFSGGFSAATSTFTAKVGVGTTSPWASLAVQALIAGQTNPIFEIASSSGASYFSISNLGAIAAAGAITSTATTANTFPYASSTALTVSGTGYFGTASSTNLTVSALTSGRIPFITTAGAFTDSSAFAFDSSLARLTVTNASTTALSVSGNAYFAGSGIWNSGGSVGIGTTTPNRALMVQGSAGFGSSATAAGVVLQTNGSVGEVLGINNANNTYNGLQFSTGASPALSITTAGNVGIGTTSPSAKLEVVNTSSGAAAEQLYLTNFASATSTASRMTFRAADVSGSATSTGAITAILQQNFNTGKSDLAFSTLQSGTLTEVFRATNLGNVGVGTTTPLRRFAVEQAASAAQFSVAYDTTRVTEIQTDSSGDVIINPSGDDVRLNDDNLWVCSGGSCPSGTPSGTGKLLVETALGVGTSTPLWPLTASHATLPQLALTDGKLTLSVGGLLSVGASSTGQLATLGTATSTFNGDIKITGKLDVGTIDPVYTIGGIKYATYGHSTVGIKEETVQIIHLEKADDGSYAYTIDFDALKKGSDLWLFYQITDFGKNWNTLVVSLTPAFEGTVYYVKNVAENTLTIKSDKKGEVSMRLIGNRFDFSKWPNLRSDQDGDTRGTHIISTKPTPTSEAKPRQIDK
ncbi:MAG: platelet-binding glycoprotein [Parcubacteria group bacterium Athens0416_74]|nr:MAG: platelet-binding glycoprotein [Parcubacteria group bacterium Athens0416_74]